MRRNFGLYTFLGFIMFLHQLVKLTDDINVLFFLFFFFIYLLFLFLKTKI